MPFTLSEFVTHSTEVANLNGMPTLRIQFVWGPTWGRSREQIRKMTIEGNNPLTGKPAMPELVAKLLTPLTDEEKRTGELKRDMGPAVITDTHDNLQRFFLERRWTDFLPVILPTEEKVEDMLKGTSHDPDEVLGKMTPVPSSESWSYTVRTTAINAVMTGCKPEYLPILLAAGSTGLDPINVADSAWVPSMVINGTIRDEIGLNYKIGAVGPWSHANTTIGRAWSLLGINGGNCGKAGTTYMGTVGNPMNTTNIIIAENESDSPWEPFAVRRGYKRGQNIVSLFRGWGLISSKNFKANDWSQPANMDFPKIIKEIIEVHDSLFGATAVLCPPVANFVKDAGYDTVEKFTEWIVAPPAGQKPYMRSNQVDIIVTGASNNNYWSMGALGFNTCVEIDKWR